jgi:2-phospho-L-lactate guanylyltransferase
VVPDRADAGLNPALRWGARVAAQRLPGAGIGALSADLPAVRPHELAAVLRFAAGVGAPHRPIVVADAHGRGTTAYLSPTGAPFDPAFGAQSLNTHLQAGARAFVEADVPSLRRDVDTIADLRAALQLGVGEHTAALVAGFTERQIGA